MGDQYQNTRPTHYVAIGASAGGLEALKSFFKNTPADSELGFIVVQHLSPNYKSMMPELLGKHTTMPIRVITDGVLVEANNIYLIPPRKNISIVDGKLYLAHQDRNDKQFLPIDTFLESLANDQAEKAIAVILSGAGSDGTKGARCVKLAGGIVMVQNEKTAKFGSMPNNTKAAGIVDLILPPEEMPGKLLSFISYPRVKNLQLSDDTQLNGVYLAQLFSLINKNENIDFTHYKLSTISRRIERRMGFNQIDTLADYVGYLKTNPHEVTKLYNELLIGVTHFFRDKEAFKLLSDKYLVELFEKTDNEIRIWVAGCSTGEEAYTIAILCKEILARLDKKNQIKIFATDLDERAVTHASIGVYPESIFVDVPRNSLSKYFLHQRDSLKVSHELREMVVFAKHNIINDPPFTNINLVTCRNLLIYLDIPLQKKVLDMFNFSLNSKGLLLLGPSESVSTNQTYFELLDSKWKLYRCKGRRKSLLLNNFDNQISGFKEPLQVNKNLEIKQAVGDQEQEQLLDRLSAVLSDEYVPTTLIINEKSDVVYVMGETDNLLRHSTGRISNNAAKILPNELSIPVTTGIRKVFRDGQEIYYTNIRISSGNGNFSINARLKKLPNNKNQAPLLAIFLERIKSREISPDDDASSIYNLDKAAEQRIKDLEQELQLTRESLQMTVEEVETSNEELQSANEELLASNEELQSTNEELQSVNEELHTVNSEHQSKILDLVDLNNDLDNLLSATNIATIFLDKELCVRRFTPEATTLIRIIGSDIGRPFDHLVHSVQFVNLVEILKGVITSGNPVERKIMSDTDEYYLLRVFPYYITPKSTSGVVMTFINITQTIKTQNALSIANERYALAQKAANIGSWDWNIKTDSLTWSDAIEPMFGFKKGEFDTSFEGFVKSVFPEDRQQVNDALSNAINNKKNYFIEHRIQWPTGEIRWVSETGEVVYDSNGNATRVLGIVQDINQRKLTENKLNQSEIRHRTVLETMVDAIIIIDNNGIIESINPATERMFMYTEEELKGQNVSVLMPKDIGKYHDQYLSDYIESGNAKIIGIGRNLRAQKKNGDIFPIFLSVAEMVIGNRRLFNGVIRDLSHEFEISQIPTDAHSQQRFHESEKKLEPSID